VSSGRSKVVVTPQKVYIAPLFGGIDIGEPKLGLCDQFGEVKGLREIQSFMDSSMET
jgi:hypothetical protein